MALDPTTIPPALAVAQIDDDHFEVPSSDGDPMRDVVNGVQLMAYAMVASALGRDTAHTVKSAHGMFARPTARSAPIELELDRFYAGRAFSMDTVTVRQRDKNAARVELLLHGAEPDLIRHADQMPTVPGPDDCPPFLASAVGIDAVDMRVVGGVDYVDQNHEIRPPVLDLWMRATEGTASQVLAQALLTASTGTMLIGTAMLPHAGIGQSQAHRTISTGVVGHTVHFHEPFEIDDWLLLAQESVYAGGGRTHGRARVFRQDGALVATYAQDAMIRNFTDGKDHSAESKRVM
jgi:acyl-CoA thioesterase-2